MQGKNKIEADYDFRGAVLTKQKKTKKYRFSQDAKMNIDGASMNIHQVKIK